MANTQKIILNQSTVVSQPDTCKGCFYMEVYKDIIMYSII